MERSSSIDEKVNEINATHNEIKGKNNMNIFKLNNPNAPH